jgi:hypothetical protein
MLRTGTEIGLRRQKQLGMRNSWHTLQKAIHKRSRAVCDKLRGKGIGGLSGKWCLYRQHTKGVGLLTLIYSINPVLLLGLLC